jgi:hypothetical protein
LQLRLDAVRRLGQSRIETSFSLRDNIQRLRLVARAIGRLDQLCPTSKHQARRCRLGATLHHNCRPFAITERRRRIGKGRTGARQQQGRHQQFHVIASTLSSAPAINARVSTSP